jgi:hypothetical protein
LELLRILHRHILLLQLQPVVVELVLEEESEG